MHYKSFLALIVAALIAAFVPIQNALGQTNSYTQTNLVADTNGAAANVDPMLINPWGVAYFPNQPFWVSDNNSGYSTLYNQNGIPSGQFLVPAPAGSGHSSTPTGIVANLAQTGFNVNGKTSLFIFDTEDGTISGWNGTDPVTLKVDKSGAGAVYKSLALITNNTGSFLLAANFNTGAVEVYDSGFNSRDLAGAFVDPSLPAGYAPFGIHVINGQVLVSYALQDAAKHDPVHQAGAGYLNLFDVNGNFLRRVASQGTLNAPWGAVIPPAGFGAFATKLLIGNFGDGTISAFDLASGNFIDQMKDSTGAPIVNASLWELIFGGGGAAGDPNTMYITAGLANEQHGLFASIVPNAANPPITADFNVSAPTTATVRVGQSTTLAVTINALNGFNSEVQFSCSGEPANSICTFTPATVTPAAGGMVSTSLKLSTRTAGGPYGMIARIPNNSTRLTGLVAAICLLSICGFTLLSIRFGNISSQTKAIRFAFSGAASLVLLAVSLVALGGCGSGSSSTSSGGGTPPGTTTLVITAKSGTLSHSTNVALTIN
jgi:uncharacterized protein (TIGR03118 family)